MSPGGKEKRPSPPFAGSRDQNPCGLRERRVSHSRASSQPIRLEHEELLPILAEAITLGGRVASAAKAVTTVPLHPRAEMWEAYALPLLGLLPKLAAGTVKPEMGRVLAMTDLLKASLATRQNQLPAGLSKTIIVSYGRRNAERRCRRGTGS